MVEIADKTVEYSNPKTYEALEQGVYLMLVYNDSEYDVFDRNGKGKLLVRAKSYMLKSGKFEGGLSARMKQNYLHFHRRRTDDCDEVGIFPGMVKMLLVHTLSAGDTKKVRVIERDLNRAVRCWLKEMKIHEPDQSWHSESRRICGVPPSSADISAFFSGVIELHQQRRN